MRYNQITDKGAEHIAELGKLEGASHIPVFFVNMGIIP